MSLFLDTRGNPTLGIGICGRCSRKFPLHMLHQDPNSPGLRVCREDMDQYDPWRLPAKPPDDIVLPFTRPDTPLGVSWQLIAQTTQAVPGGAYLCDTSAASFTLTLPASPTITQKVQIADYANTFPGRPLTVGRNGERIQGAPVDLVLRSSETIALVFHGGTDGWLIDQVVIGEDS